MTVLRLSLVLLLAGFGGVPSVLQAQPADSTEALSDTTMTESPVAVDRVVTAFSEGSANHLLTPSADRVEISLFGARTYYSSAQALYVLREFFRDHAPHRFSVEDVMGSETSCFVRGTYEQVRAAQRLHVYVRLGRVGEEAPWHLQEVNIEVAPE